MGGAANFGAPLDSWCSGQLLISVSAIESVRARLWEPKTLLFPMLQRDLGLRKQDMCANLSSGPKNGTGNIQNPIATARFRCPETGTVCKFVHRSQKRDGNYSKSYCYGAISDDQNRDVQICPNWSRFKSEMLIDTCISTSTKHDAHSRARTHGRTAFLA